MNIWALSLSTSILSFEHHLRGILSGCNPELNQRELALDRSIDLITQLSMHYGEELDRFMCQLSRKSMKIKSILLSSSLGNFLSLICQISSISGKKKLCF